MQNLICCYLKGARLPRNSENLYETHNETSEEIFKLCEKRNEIYNEGHMHWKYLLQDPRFSCLFDNSGNDSNCSKQWK